MDIHHSKERIEFKKEFNALDKLTFDFSSILNKLEIKYAVVSGYVSIIFGRNRTSEDVDIIIEKISNDHFNVLWKELHDGFECITTSNPNEAFSDYLISSHAIRFSKKNKFIPNIEIKFPKIDFETWVLNNRKEVIVNDKKIYLSPIEMQISFKLYLGSEKDIEDAKYLYELFKDKLDMKLFNGFNRKLKISDKLDKYLR